MADQSSPSPGSTVVQSQLQAVAQALHNAQSLDSETRQALADFIEELSRTLEAAPAPSRDLSHLTECTTHLLQAAHQAESPGIPAAVRGRFEAAVLGVQTQFPNVAALARSLVDALANIGI